MIGELSRWKCLLILPGIDIHGRVSIRREATWATASIEAQEIVVYLEGHAVNVVS